MKSPLSILAAAAAILATTTVVAQTRSLTTTFAGLSGSSSPDWFVYFDIDVKNPRGIAI